MRCNVDEQHESHALGQEYDRHRVWAVNEVADLAPENAAQRVKDGEDTYGFNKSAKVAHPWDASFMLFSFLKAIGNDHMLYPQTICVPSVRCFFCCGKMLHYQVCGDELALKY